MTNNLLSDAAIGGTVKQFLWNWENQEIRVVYQSLGNGSPLLLLPAFSTVSSREEVGELAKLLSRDFQTVAVDWPGFGESSRLAVNYNPAIYQQFLTDFVTSIFKTPVAVVAAGHASSYILQLAAKHPSAFSRILLVAPTWRGPLPTMGANPKIAGMVKDLVRSPILGQALYKLNTLPSFLKWMYSRHVYVDVAKLTPEFIDRKWRNTQQPRARFAPAAFVTGSLDAITSQTDFLALVRSLSIPLMVIIGESSPPKSRVEMEALAASPGVKSVLLPGTLGMHEEFPIDVYEATLPFLKGNGQ
jgi:pimeloyl-ACP methyl ester carboxylesterase